MEREGAYTILVVNDVPEQLSLMKAQLRKTGYRVVTACDGLDGFQRAQFERPALVISDVMMPFASGIDLCRMIRSDVRLRNIPVLLVSALNKGNASVIEGLQAGADDYLEAPYEPMRLVAKVTRLIERWAAEETLKKEHEFTSAIVETVADLVVVTDPQGHIIRFNRACQQLSGYTFEEVKGRSFWELLLPPEEVEPLRRIFAQMKPSQLTQRHENHWITKDGERRIISWTNAVLSGDERVPHYVIGTGVDITERRAAEEALRMAEQRAINEYERMLDRLASLAQTFGTARDLKAIFRALSEFASVSTPCCGLFISLYDPETNMRKAVYVSSEGEEIEVNGLPPMPMTNSPHSRAVATGKIIVEDDFQSVMVNQPTVNVGNNIDPRLPRSACIVPMNFMGRTLGAIEIQSPELAAFKHEHATAMRMAANLAAVAIENVRLFERERARAEQEAESEKMRSLGQLAAGVAHDFNNSLAAILGRTQLLLRGATDEKQRRSLQVIETAALDAAETVRRIQTFARRAPGEQLSVISITKLITDAIQLTRTRWEDDARARGIHYDIRFSPDYEGSDEIAANPSEVREVLVNLIFNALDAMPSGGRVEIVERRAGGFITVEVRDTGQGVPPALHDRIFEPFFTTKGPQGSGLGLAVSYSIIHRHGGTIEVESEVGHGTTFRLRFPQTRNSPAKSIEKRRTSVPARRVLVVDDEDVVREVLVEMLKELKQQVTEARNADEALDHLASSEFDLMITDLSMPGMDGLKLAVEAHKIAPAMMIALATGYGQSLPRNDSPGNSHINLILNKPFQLSDLEASLLSLHSGEKVHR